MSDVAPGVATDPGLLRTRRGAVERFDAHEGIGTVVTDGVAYPFHCTAIFDGSRRIDPGTEVRFLLLPGQLGRVEARDIVPVVPPVRRHDYGFA